MFFTVPKGSDWVGYETLVEFIVKNNILSVSGDLVEIGTFLGGGAQKLSVFLEKNSSDKLLYVIDVFDPTFDWTKNTGGRTMSSLYLKALSRYKGKSQYAIFRDNTGGCRNIKVLIGDSKKLVIPSERLCFCFIDGNHSPDYVENDFNLVWGKLASKGAVAFHDYNGDLPQTTAKIDELIRIHKEEMAVFFEEKKKRILFVQKK